MTVYQQSPGGRRTPPPGRPALSPDALPAALTERLRHARVFVYTPGRTIVEQGADPDAVHVIDEGVVKVVRTQPDARTALLELRSRGWMLGLAEALLDRPHATTAETLSPCTVRRLPAPEFRLLVDQDREVSRHVQRLLSQHVYDHIVKVTWFSGVPARRRLESLLGDLIAAQGPSAGAGHVRVPATLKYWEMAQAIGVNASYLSRLLHELEDDGVLQRRKGWLVVSDPSRLASLAS